LQVTAQIGFVDGAIIERFNCYEGTSAKTKLAKDLHVQGVNFFARTPAVTDGIQRVDATPNV
jgi:hypothetical protein